MMNPEAGLLQSHFRRAVEAIAKDCPTLKWQEVFRRAGQSAASHEMANSSTYQPEPVATRELVQEELF